MVVTMSSNSSLHWNITTLRTCTWWLANWRMNVHPNELFSENFFGWNYSVLARLINHPPYITMATFWTCNKTRLRIESSTYKGRGTNSNREITKLFFERYSSCIACVGQNWQINLDSMWNRLLVKHIKIRPFKTSHLQFDNKHTSCTHSKWK